MPYSLDQIQECLRYRAHLFRYASLWLIQRTDTSELRFTDHSSPIEFDGETYTPIGGVEATAREMEESLKDRNLELRGLISSAAITFDDLRAGLYRNALIVERLVDWKYPWAGSWRTRKYWVADTEFSPTGWRGQLEGITTQLKRAVGEVVCRTCGHNLGDLKCTINIATHTISSTVTSVDAYSRLRFYDTVLMAQIDHYFTYGVVTFTDGENDGLSRPIVSSRDSDGQVRVAYPFPFNIAVGDGYDIYPGCGRTKEYCKGTAGTKGRPWANNIANFSGKLYVPGNDRMLQTPNAK